MLRLEIRYHMRLRFCGLVMTRCGGAGVIDVITNAVRMIG
jgi:hypothetical protein